MECGKLSPAFGCGTPPQAEQAPLGKAAASRRTPYFRAALTLPHHFPGQRGWGRRSAAGSKSAAERRRRKAHRGTATGRAKSCRVRRRSLNEGKPKPASLGDRGQSPGGEGGGFHVAKGCLYTATGASTFARKLRRTGKLETGGFTTRLILGASASPGRLWAACPP